MRKKLLVIGGATATGKTALAIRLAQQFDTAILSADSRQFYREMNIGTAKPDAEELAAAPHHFIDFLSVTQDYSVGDFERDALHCLEGIFQEKDLAILVGGSGLYLKAVCEGMDKFPPVSPETRQIVETGEREGGLAWLQEQLQLLDPVQYERVDRQNPARMRRALEVCLETGRPYSSFLQQQSSQPRPFDPIYLLLDMPRELLYQRIEARVDRMIAAGLEAEARALRPYRDRPPLRTVGYEEFFEYFDGKMDFETTVDKIKQHSRNYAKRQVTWFSKYGKWQIFSPAEEEKILDFVALNLSV